MPFRYIYQETGKADNTSVRDQKKQTQRNKKVLRLRTGSYKAEQTD